MVVAFPKDYDCRFADMLYAILADADKEAVADLLADIYACDRKSHLTKEQIGTMFMAMLMEVTQYNSGDA